MAGSIIQGLFALAMACAYTLVTFIVSYMHWTVDVSQQHATYSMHLTHLMWFGYILPAL